jgi:predicted nuclease with TOPRIM domain
MEKNKQDAFTTEAEVLNVARQKIADANLTPEQVREAFTTLADDYERVLEEVKFLTKVSDKLEAKVNAQNEKLQEFNKMLAKEAEDSKTVAQKTLQQNKKLSQAKTELDKQVGNTQMVLIVVIAALVVVILVFVYWTFLRDIIK